MPLRPALMALLVLLAPVGCASHGAEPSARTASAETAQAAALDPVSSAEWANDMARFRAEDAATPLPPHPIVFTGSSSVRTWSSLADDFRGNAVINRGFGGSQIRDAAHFEHDVVGRYAPRQVVIYAGDNDIDAGRSQAQLLSDFMTFVARAPRDAGRADRLALDQAQPGAHRPAAAPAGRKRGATRSRRAHGRRRLHRRRLADARWQRTPASRTIPGRRPAHGACRLRDLDKNRRALLALNADRWRLHPGREVAQHDAVPRPEQQPARCVCSRIDPEHVAVTSGLYAQSPRV